ncbi:hypothetical protein CLV47_10437 [Antricoccus suffuscus]|uniref:Uncharacterized protein n=1 Tax=Antricoccus suffuscus TaxID=1629062 RepID=A0A2T1A282_9ACTN|nr:hypothetical protein CLV47_10437 [Antricoccus suffuscus]
MGGNVVELQKVLFLVRQKCADDCFWLLVALGSAAPGLVPPVNFVINMRLHGASPLLDGVLSVAVTNTFPPPAVPVANPPATDPHGPLASYGNE